jgi:hypothetical protein
MTSPAWMLTQGCVEVEPGVFEDSTGRVFVDPGTWAEWGFRCPVGVARERERRKHWLQHHGWYQPSLEEWRMYCHRQREVIADLEAELAWQRLETIRARAGL